MTAGEKKEGKKNNKFLLTLSSHIWDCNALSWLHKYTPTKWLKWRGKVKARVPQCKVFCRIRVNMLKEKYHISDVVSVEGILTSISSAFIL